MSGAIDRYDHREDNDDYSQAGALFRLMSSAQQGRLTTAIAAAMRGVPEEIVDRQLAHFDLADSAYGEGIRGALRDTAH